MRGNGVAIALRLRLLHNRSSSMLTDAPLPAQRCHQAGSNQRRPPIRVPQIASAPPRCRREPSQQSCLVAKRGQKNPQSLDRGLAVKLSSLALALPYFGERLAASSATSLAEVRQALIP